MFCFLLTSAPLLDQLGGDEGALDGADGLAVDDYAGHATWSQNRYCCQLLPIVARKKFNLTLESVHGGDLDGQLAVPGCVHAT